MKKKIISIMLLIASLIMLIGCGRSDIENQAIKYYETIDDYMSNDIEIPNDMTEKISYYIEKIEASNLTEHEYDIVTGIYKMYDLSRSKAMAQEIGTHKENRDYMKEYTRIKKEVAKTLNID